MFSRSRRRNRDISKADWRKLASIIAYKACGVIMVPPQGTTKECPRCGAWNRVPKGATTITCSKCGLTRDRQKGAALNIWLRAANPLPQQWLQIVDRWRQELSASKQ
jgi:putative transposase